jgi:hypothetical protein
MGQEVGLEGELVGVRVKGGASSGLSVDDAVGDQVRSSKIGGL